uniref:Uncharacterized protein n=1 Tax=viral metagenome TaxID=1070528 RepID=A0A6C0KR73_9ZZZZ
MPGKRNSGLANDRRAYIYNYCPEPCPVPCLPPKGLLGYNGYPVNQYTNNCKLNSVEALYSIWDSYQSTLAAQFSTIQKSVSAPDNLINPPSGPANIFIIRHGEKNYTNYGLDPNGIYRASQIANFINDLANSGYPISYIITCHPDPYNKNDGSGSMHPEHTVTCASFLLNLPHIMYSSASDVATTAKALYDTGIYNGLNILICWEHQNIQRLCLEILNEGKKQTIPRISQNNANDFFKETNACPDGNYVTTNPTSPFYPSQQQQVDDNYKDSQYYPYWNSNNYDSVYCFYSNQPNNTFTFQIKSEPCITCFKSCKLNIGLYQNPAYPYYSKENDIESVCKVPTEWSV